MSSVRRWYVYIVCAISLQAVAWAIIALLRNLFIFGIDPLAVAFQIAVIIIGLPLFLAHWLWGQRLVDRDKEERGATLRRIYLYGSMAGFLGPFTANAFDLIRRLMGGTNEFQSYDYNRIPVGDAVIYHLVAMSVLGVMWFYHQRVTAEDSRVLPETGGSATVRRFYILGFSAAGLYMTTLTIIHLLRWTMYQVGSSPIRAGGMSLVLIDEITRLLIGVPLWVIFWQWAQRLFDGPSGEEGNSALRKFYLYGAVFIGALGAVGNSTMILASLIRSLLGLPSEGDIRGPLPIVIGMGILWAYHALVLRDDAQKVKEAPRQAGVRRLYHYLIAAIGLSAMLIGLSGDISVILRALDTSFGTGLKDAFAWFTAAIIAGTPVWIIPWGKVQALATRAGAQGADARRSVVRRIYLYFFVFLATMTVLSSMVYIVFRILSMVLGEDAPTLTELGHAISYSIIAVGVWLYHGSVLRVDRKMIKREQGDKLEALRVVIADIGEGGFGKAVVDRLKQEFADIILEPILLTPKLSKKDQDAIGKQLSGAGLIVGPWEIAVGNEAVDKKIASGVVSSPARKLLIPTRSDQWNWAGVEDWDSEALVGQTVGAVKQVLAGEEVKAQRPMSIGSIIGIIIGVLFLLILLAIPLLMYFSF